MFGYRPRGEKEKDAENATERFAQVYISAITRTCNLQIAPETYTFNEEAT